MSVNVRNMRARDGENAWELRRELLFKIIRQNQPDLMATQEAFFPQVEQMREAFPEYDSVGVGRDDGKKEGEYCALFFLRNRFHLEAQDTFWFSETPDVPGSRHWTRHHPRICTWAKLNDNSGVVFFVYNVHMDHESQLAREKSVRLLLEHFQRPHSSNPAILMGDFNMEEDNPALANLRASTNPALQDTFRAIHPDAKECGTFHGFTGRVDGEKIDYIFASDAFEVRDTRILHENSDGHYPSDHFPITASLCLIR